MRVLRAELTRTSDRQRLLQFARRWLYEHRLIVLRERDLQMMISKAIRQHEAGLARTIVEAVDSLLLAQWRATMTRPHERGTTVQSWLWATPAKHSSRQIEEVIERIELLTALGVDRHLTDLPDAILRRYARRLAARAPAVAARIAEPARTIEVACFLRYCLLTQTDHLLLMVRRRVVSCSGTSLILRISVARMRSPSSAMPSNSRASASQMRILVAVNSAKGVKHINGCIDHNFLSMPVNPWCRRILCASRELLPRR